ncbi:NAD(P)/FAD-dependent oxidoreductase [Antrihabitans sp. YC2-6]|uniref:flavin-containing monooxygenase n=1 Tax=Antrihabitans sp. YC2-6 TaxID=2799498 RepID=UPI0018F52A45|nr:NAD(P)/FAD-dependent oxidoreductase [Antrihabitans sp. YC2-6]MBJ8348736.1 NAD(P)/FAD-dependent oxidoreductase [Antrihabitans sp. YC2-6]
MTREPAVAVVGAGMSGMCMAIKLLEAGITDVTIYEKSHDVGGTWRDNTYPGLSCDVPSRFYQYTFAANPNWTHLFSPGPEIQKYFSGIADRFDLRSRIRFRTEIVEARFDADRWHLRTSRGTEHVVDFLVSATGILRELRYPKITGLADFGGPTMHSARWDHSVETTGKRVAVIGTGSTGVQIVCGLAEEVGRLELFQRSAQWILPTPNPAYTPLAGPLHRRIPLMNRIGYRTHREVIEFFSKALVKPGWHRTVLTKICEANLRSVRDPELRRKLTPDHLPMCRRLIVSGGFYRAIQRENVDLVTEAIDHIEQRGIVTEDGRLHEVDVIVLATGFDAHAYMRPMNLIGRDGITIDDAWEGGPRARLTVAIPGFPNFFMIMGPHSPVGNYSLVAIAETQCKHIVRWIEKWRAGTFDSVAPTPEATAGFNAEMRAALPNTVWATGCTSWYLGKDGLPELWPWAPDVHRDRLLAPPDLDDYELRTTQPAK